MPGLNFARRTYARLKNRLLSKAIILMYHRVVELESDPWLLCVTPSHFAEHLEVISRLGRPASLSALVKELQASWVMDRTIVVTFDDGYTDNLYQAKPALERYGIPATVYVVAGAVGRETEFWWDDLERLLLIPPRLPEILTLNLEGRTTTWLLGQAAVNHDGSRYKDRNLEPSAAPPGSRLAFFYSVWQILLPLTEQARSGALHQIASWLGVENAPRATHRIMNADEVMLLQQDGLVEVGAHTATHASLPTLSRDAQFEELQRGKTMLEELLSTNVQHFAYPHGEYTQETISVAREVGFQSACTIVPRSLYQGADPLLLPRFNVRDWDGDEFSRRLSEWFRTGREF